MVRGNLCHVRYFGLVMMTWFGFTSVVSATVVSTTSNNGSVAAYNSDISSTDLVNVSQSTLSSTTASQTVNPGYTLNGIHDGLAPGAQTLSAYWQQPGGVDVTFTLDTTTNTLGYDITGTTSIAAYHTTGFAEYYGNQTYDVSYSTVSAPLTFIPLTSVSYQPFSSGSGSSKVILSDTTGVLASGVKAIRFHILPTPIAGNTLGETAVYREVDVFGVATTVPAPEPASFSLLALAGLGFVVMQRRRRCKSSAGAGIDVIE